MGISRTEVNLLRLLDSALRQQNQAKLIHYITTSQGLLEQLAAETAEGISSVSKAKLNEYSDKIEELAAMLAPEVAEQIVSEKERDAGAPIRLDGAAQVRIDKHRQLQEGLIDEMVELVHQLNESSLIMNRSLQEMEKKLDSTETAVEHSLAGTGHANARAMEVYSLISKTTCLQWLLFFIMICMFTMVVLLIRIT